MSEIYFGDCFENMKKIKDKSIKLVLLDLPYGQTACKWDSCIDLNKMWIEFDRICDNKCQYLFFCSTKFGVSIINSRPNWFRTDFVFKKTLVVGFLSCKFNPLRAHEMIYVFSNPKKHNDVAITKLINRTLTILSFIYIVIQVFLKKKLIIFF